MAAPTRSRPTAGTTRRRSTARWDGLDAARGLAVALALLSSTAAALGPSGLGPTSWAGLGAIDLLPGVFLVLAGAGVGWQHDAGAGRSARRWARRAAVLVAAGSAVSLARAGGDPAAMVADELLRLLLATALATAVLRWRPVVVGLVAAVASLMPAVLAGGGPLGRGLRSAAPAAAWRFEGALGLPVPSTAGATADTGVSAAGFVGAPLTSLPGALALVLAGVALGIWAHRRPPGVATSAAFATLGCWCLVATVAVGQVVPPVPVLLDLPVGVAAVGTGALLVAAGHLTASARLLPALGPLGRVALPVVAAGAVVVALLPPGIVPELPALAALTAGGVVAAGVSGLARRLDARGWRLRA